jgi:hypothetical protein
MNVVCARVLTGEYECIEITYTKFVCGVGTRRIIDYVYSYPLGGWTELIFDGESPPLYTNFLNTMVFKNIEVQRKMAKLVLDSILEVPWMYRINLLNAVCILDPTFVPPRINTNCRWQNELMEDIVSSYSLMVIATCRNEKRLERYFNALQALTVRQS